MKALGLKNTLSERKNSLHELISGLETGGEKSLNFKTRH